MMNNRQLADTFELIANLSEIKGENIYKTLAYRRAAESLLSLGREASEYWKEGKLEEIPGVGKAIAEKIDELMRTGKLEFLEKLKKEVPASLATWLPVPGLGPKKAALIWKTLGIETLPELEKAAREGRLHDLPGMGAKSEQQILSGIESLSRRSTRIPLGRAYPLAQEICRILKGSDGVVEAEPAGSLRRMRSTVGDLDILVAAADSRAVMETFIHLPRVQRVLGQGETKASI
ncbi:MAG: helix-hairpin-helix domain-containing protein, partial [Bacteroidota bacterium]